MADRDTLLGMGFTADRVDWALHATRSSGLQPAMDHLLAHSEEPVPDYKNAPAPATAAGAADYDDEDQAALMDMLGKQGQSAQDEMIEGAQEAKSIKCVECGKILKSPAFASFHAEKSGHTNFEESTEEVKPLTEEEKKAKLAELRDKLAAKRAAQSKDDAKEAKANEQIRRKAGRDMGEAREEMKKKEAVREAEKRKAEARANVEAKRRVREQIEQDKRERAEKAAREKALREGGPVPVSAPAASSKPGGLAAALAGGAGANGANTNEARLRVRAPKGTWTGTLPADKTLGDVAKLIQEAGMADGGLNFSTTFPRKQFGSAELGKSLKELGLVPNAALEASAAP
ncbi:dna-binding protein [Ceraceosorus bombacis]|uniref:Dna-binding protein n=1 Tax=Ceraceosorus bombacis TaxID=401625 RepID=A0A0P1BMH3_9BASI|nr:dna-binding protein [Ceraceosorus bombacis]